MTGRDDRTLIAVFLAVVALVAAAIGGWRWHEGRRPRLLAVDVVVRVSGASGASVASDGERVLPAGSELEAAALVSFRRGNGPVRRICGLSPVEVGGETVTVETLEAWPRGYGELRATWFSVEPAYFGWDGVTAETADRLAYKDFVAAELGNALVVRPTLEAHNDDFLSEPLPGNRLHGGVLRLAAHVGVFRDEQDLLPQEAAFSPGATAILAGGVTTMVVAPSLPAELHPEVARFLRLGCFTFAPGVWPDGGSGWSLPLTPLQLVRRALIITPEALAAVAGSGDPLMAPWHEPVPLVWAGSRLVVGGTSRELLWGGDVAPADCLRAGRQHVVLLSDDGDGVLSGGDRALFAWRAPARTATVAEALPGAPGGLELLRRRLN